MLANYLVGKQSFLRQIGEPRNSRQFLQSLFSCLFSYSFILNSQLRWTVCTKLGYESQIAKNVDYILLN